VDVKTTIRVILVPLIVLASAPSSWPQAARSTYDPAANERPSKPRVGFVDFTLKRINPSDKDYGQMISAGRNLLLAETIENGYFWSNVVSLGLLGCLFILVVYQQKHLNRAEWKSAEIMAQYEHALKRANAQVADATKRNSEIIEVLVGLKEPTVCPQPARTNNNEVAVARQPRARPAEPPASSAESPRNGTNKAVKATAVPTTAGADAGAQIGLFKPDVDLITRVNSLEQLLARSKGRENELVRQLNDAGRKLQAEQDKNRSLKGG
jgi:nitroreductase